MKHLSSRRNFISNSAKVGFGTVLAAETIGSLLTSCSTSRSSQISTVFKTGFDQEPLPYAYNALEPWIDTQTMDIHYNKHAAAYSKNVKEAAKAENVDTNRAIEEVLGNISKYSVKMRNNAGGHYNHELFWKLLKANATAKPSGKFLTAIETDFGSLSAFQEKFSDAAKNRFGSGWAWLVLSSNKKLIVTSTPNQDNPLMDLSGTASEPFIKGIPLVGLDVWEHAYYLKYQNRRKDYVENFWKILNWEFVQQRFELVS
jgi:superoxide dismutase, Fe-Mn family